MSTIEERRNQRFYNVTIATLKDIEERGLQLPQDERYAAAYGILRAYVESLLTNFAEAFTAEQLAEIRIVLDQLSKLTIEDEHLDDATKAKLDQLARALRESESQSDLVPILREEQALDEYLDEEEEDTDGDGSGLHQCPYCYNQVNDEHEEFCSLNPNRNRNIVP